MTKLLFDTQPLIIIPELAVLVGLNEAIILQQVHYWTEHNRKAGSNLKEGFTWTFNSYKDWQKQFPFWSTDTIKRAILKLEKLRLLISASFNSLKIDKTKWYRINYEILDAFYRDAKVSGNGEGSLHSSMGQFALMDGDGIYDDRIMVDAAKSTKARKPAFYR
jgi:hypothetical protein